MHIILTSNTAWSIYNFRKGLILKFLTLGFKVTTISPQDDFSKLLLAMGCNVIDIPLSAKGINPVRDLLYMLRLSKIYRSETPDLIIHYTIKPNIYGSAAAAFTKKPCLCVVTGLGYTFINKNIISFIARQLYKLSFHFPRQIWFLNRDDLFEFQNYNLVSSNKCMLLPGEGVDTNFYSPRSGNVINDQKITFLLISRLLRDKGIGEFIDAARIIKRKYPNVSFNLLGACDSENPSAYSREQVNSWVSEGIVSYLGVVTDVRDAIATSDCVVLPSYREGVPRTLLEAASMGKPVIATNAPGCRDVVVDGVTGFKCTVKDPDSLAASLEKIINLTPEDRGLMGDAGRKFICENYDEASVIEFYLKFIKGLADPSGPLLHKSTQDSNW